MRAWATKKVGSFSKGMQQRVGLAQALLHDPDLLLLDEPTDGVDPVGRREIRQLLLQLRDEGRTILVNSHILAELEPLCTQVAILVKGTLAREGRMAELTAGNQQWTLTCSGLPPAWLEEIAGLKCHNHADGVELTMAGDAAETMQQVLDRVRSEGRTVTSLRQSGETLEDLFMRSLDESAHADAAVPGAVTGKRQA